MLLFNDLMEKIFEAAKQAVPGLEKRDIDIDKSGHADFSLMLFRISKQYNKSPEELYDRIRNALNGLEFIGGIARVGNYVNFSIKPETYFKEIEESLQVKGQYPDIFQDPERVSVEHTSANPTGPLHVGRARNSIIGDSTARLLERYGYRVTTQYFINDSGKQMLFLYEGHKRFSKELNENALLEGYREIYTKVREDPGIEDSIKSLTERYEKGDNELIDEIHEIASIMLEGIKKSLKDIGIEHNDYTFESDFIRSGEIDHILEGMEEHLKDEDGALYVELPNERKIFLKRRDGTSLYFARDIAYHLYKLQNYDWLVNILGEDHKLHGTSLQYVLRNMLDIENRIDITYYGFVRLESGKMSTRKGNVVSLPGLIERMNEESYDIVKEKRPDLEEETLKSISEAVAASSIRFNIIRVGANKSMIFKWSEALNFEGDSAPFIMYSYARASSILRKVEGSQKPVSIEFNKYEGDLLRQMYFYPYHLIQATKSLRPDIIANYSLSLVKKFNDFYSNCTVLDEDSDVRNRRLELVKMYKNILQDSCKIIGIKLLEEM
ncbi:arginyl-tRNA synthetase [uncultured archaeon]|nr:arginyl-tRNA synthetase [uncultured archaeon]